MRAARAAHCARWLWLGCAGLFALMLPWPAGLIAQETLQNAVRGARGFAQRGRGRGRGGNVRRRTRSS